MRKLMFVTMMMASVYMTLAHDMWLESDQFRGKVGEEFVLRLGNGTIFEISENAVQPARVEVVSAIWPGGGIHAVTGAVVEGNWLTLRFQPEEPGNFWITLGTKPRLIQLSAADFNSYLEHDGLPHVLTERQEKGILDRAEVEEYSKFVKTYLQVGTKTSENYAVPAGLKIEIIPLENPYQLHPGQELPLRALFNGAPLEGFLVHSGCASCEGSTAAPYTDARGETAVTLSQPGRWYLRGIHLLQVDQQDHSYESYWASVTFEVQ